MRTITLGDAENIADVIHSGSNGLKIEKLEKTLFPVLFYSTAIEHQRSIVELVKLELYGSAAALVRPLFESYVKGKWFAECASSDDIALLKKDRFNKPFGLLVAEIDAKNGRGLSQPKKTYWKVLNSFTHSGAALLVRKYNSDRIGNIYSEEFIEDLLNFSSDYAILAFGHLAVCANDKDALKLAVKLGKVRTSPRTALAYEQKRVRGIQIKEGWLP
ncbi:MAG: hypothetical protein LPD71_09065, partial [Shewanella sp.]|nr:hypothetical protein [Shewanella sp.]